MEGQVGLSLVIMPGNAILQGRWQVAFIPNNIRATVKGQLQPELGVGMPESCDRQESVAGIVECLLSKVPTMSLNVASIAGTVLLLRSGRYLGKFDLGTAHLCEFAE